MWTPPPERLRVIADRLEEMRRAGRRAEHVPELTEMAADLKVMWGALRAELYRYHRSRGGRL